jgi:hypothetical protein
MPRSAIPLMVGLFMIVFAVIGLVADIVILDAAAADQMVAAYPSVVKLTFMLGIFDVIIELMQLDAGIGCVCYHRTAANRAVGYALARILLTLVTIIAVRFISGFTPAFVIAMTLLVVWPILVIVLITRGTSPSARDTQRQTSSRAP